MVRLKKLRSAIKKFSVLYLLCSLLLMVFSCKDDDKDEYIGYGIIEKRESSPQILLDKGQLLLPQGQNSIFEHLADRQRIILTFDILATHQETSRPTYDIRVNDIRAILTKNILEYSPEISDSLGLAPLSVDYAWIANDYLTFDFMFLGGQTGIRHMINLVNHPVKPENVDFLLELRHNTFGDPAHYRFRSLAAFPIHDLIPVSTLEGMGDQKLKIRIQYRGFYNEDKFFDLSWEPQRDPRYHVVDPNRLSDFNGGDLLN